MTNVIIQRAKKAIPAAYLGLQGLVLLILYILNINHWVPYVFAFLASSTYLWTSFANPGYVDYEDNQQPPRPSSKSEPIIPLNPSQIQKAINDELGVNSKIKNGCASTKLKDNHVSLVDEKNSDENVKESQQQAANNVRIDKKIKKLDQIKYFKDNIIEDIAKKEAENMVLDQIIGVRAIPVQLRQVIRWCNTCKNHQRLRVRHCHQCKRCVSTFDHHCPWMNNCIGQKNKFALITFSIIQIAQLCYLAVQLQGLLSSSPYSRSLTLLWLVIVTITLMVTSMLIFQIYLISRNITTWEQARWSKIEYLAIFNKDKMRSLFDMGAIANIKIFLKSTWSKQPTNWITLISPLAHKYVINGESPTDRGMVVK